MHTSQVVNLPHLAILQLRKDFETSSDYAVRSVRKRDRQTEEEKTGRKVRFLAENGRRHEIGWQQG